jgi:SAM-dependent methyltransferase
MAPLTSQNFHEKHMSLLKKLKLPEIHSGKPADDAAMTLLHREILGRKPFLRRLYVDFYKELADAVGYTPDTTVVELGSGGGFIKELYPKIITSDVLELTTVDKIFSACAMPFADDSLNAIMMIDVLHHIPDVRAFFREARRCLRPGGRVAMVEPANTPWGRFIYKNFHHEVFNPAAGWEFESLGPLSTANGAIPWIIFHRDRRQFESEFPSLRVVQTRFHTPFCYLLSGGFTLRQLAPAWSYPVFKALEFCLSPLNSLLGMFETIILEKS